MRKRFIAIVASATSIAAVAAAPSIEPGLYEVTTVADGGAPKTSRHCVTAAEIAKGLEMGGMSKDCRVSRKTFGDGKIDFAATCKDASLIATGSYTATTYTMDTKFHAMANGQPLDFASHATAKKIEATCKPD